MEGTNLVPNFPMQALAVASCLRDAWPVLVISPSSLRLHWANVSTSFYEPSIFHFSSSSFMHKGRSKLDNLLF